MTAGELGAGRFDRPHRVTRGLRAAAIVSAAAIAGAAIVFAVSILVARGDRWEGGVPPLTDPAVVVPAQVATTASPATHPPVATPVPTLVLPSVFIPVRPDRGPDQPGPDLRCPARLRGLCAY